jgi:uncharacterized OB-fold protein
MTERLVPPASEVAAPFWDATRGRALVLQWCTDCEQPVHYPREACPRCLGSNFDWRPASGAATVHAVSVQHRPGPGRDAADGPYAVALVELPEGVRMMTNVVGCEPDAVTVGMAVRVAWEPLPDGRNLPVFAPGP